ncbi:MAG: hypothetical protein WCZ66_12125 [Sphingomonadaceae bacterium]
MSKLNRIVEVVYGLGYDFDVVKEICDRIESKESGIELEIVKLQKDYFLKWSFVTVTKKGCLACEEDKNPIKVDVDLVREYFLSIGEKELVFPVYVWGGEIVRH